MSGDASALARDAIARLGWESVQLIMADGFFTRLLGMVAMPPVALDGAPYALAFPRCRAVHTCFMRYSLDIAFVDAGGRVLDLRRAVPPWRFVSHPSAAIVLEKVALRPWETPPPVMVPRPERPSSTSFDK